MTTAHGFERTDGLPCQVDARGYLHMWDEAKAEFIYTPDTSFLGYPKIPQTPGNYFFLDNEFQEMNPA